MLTSELVRKTRLIEIYTRHLVNDTFAGRYQAIFKGRGIEFEEVRPYTPGDEVRTIDWNVTARMGEPYVKRHVEERELSVMLVVDASGSGEFGTFDRFKRELAAELAAVLAFAATTSNDRVGLLIFTDTVELFIPPRKGRRHVTRLIWEMLAFQPRGLGTDIASALDTISKVLKRRSIIFLISDFLADPAGYSRPLFVTARRHDVVAMELNDPLEREIPDVGLLALEDAETGEIVWVDSGDAAWRKGFEDRVEQLEDGKRQAFSSARVDRVSVSTDQDYLPPLIAFFRRRSRRIARGAVRPGLA
jgi:uncharacterized protein (DUF58 family)